jgi:hypothetical protein
MTRHLRKSCRQAPAGASSLIDALQSISKQIDAVARNANERRCAPMTGASVTPTIEATELSHPV